MSDGDHVRRGVGTAAETTVRVQPYSVVVHVPSAWDPSAGPLRFSYDVLDPNRRIRRGRLYYVSLVRSRRGGTNQCVVLRRQDLDASRLTNACHELPEAECWDGRIAEGLRDRLGETVTADLSRLIVQLVVWNTEDDLDDWGAGSSICEDNGVRFVNSAMGNVFIDALVECRWDTHWCIPYDDPDEPDKGEAGMSIRVKNVRDGTAVHLQVRRIVDLANPATDTVYADASDGFQPGLAGARVEGDQVLVAGRQPKVRFNNYGAHWPVDSANNFYAIYLRFGDVPYRENAEYYPASERDYVNRERDCLHMRFTVLIHRPAGDLPEYSAAAQRLHRFFRADTKYYRSYLKTGSLRSADRWIRHFSYRYIVILLGHAGCACDHADHPVDRRGRKVDLYHAGFPPDDFVCPTRLSADPTLRRLYTSDRRGAAGCGHAEKVKHANSLAGGVWFQTYLGGASPELSVFDATSHLLLGPARLPRRYFWNGGCRTMLSRNMGQLLAGTNGSYYSGWVYSPSCDYGAMCCEFFTRWIQGSRGDPAPNEFTNSRIEPVFRAVAGRSTRPRYNPRLMNHAGVVSLRPPAGAVEDATR